MMRTPRKSLHTFIFRKKLRKACKTAQLIQNLSGPKSVSIQKLGSHLLRNFARQRANLIHGTSYMVHGTSHMVHRP